MVSVHTPITLRVRRVKIYDSGMRVVEAALHHRVTVWAQCYNCMTNSYDDPNNGDWIIVEFPDPKMASMFALTFDSSLGMERCI